MAPYFLGGIAVACLALAAWGAVVYQGWLLRSNAWADRNRRRLYWWYLRHRVANLWVMPAVVPLSLSLAVLATSGVIIAARPASDLGPAIGFVGFIGTVLSMLVAWLRPRWLMASWHRAELDREAAGLAPLMAPPPEGRSMTMTRGEQVFGYALVAGLAVAWWVFSLSPAVLIGAGTILGILAVAQVRGGRPRKRRHDAEEDRNR